MTSISDEEGERQRWKKFTDVRYEIDILQRRKTDLEARLSGVDETTSSQEAERLRSLIGRCDLDIFAANARLTYLDNQKLSPEAFKLKKKPKL